MTPTNERKSSERRAAIAGVAFVIVTAMVLAAGLSRLASDLEPQLGDIISFPIAKAPANSTTMIAVDQANASSRRSCVLDLHIMQKFGGSLMIEGTQFEPSRRFRVHWAGARTSDGRDDCGNSADLLLDSVQVAALVFAAGGTGAKMETQ
jgi:hypothetical protein